MTWSELVDKLTGLRERALLTPVPGKSHQQIRTDEPIVRAIGRLYSKLTAVPEGEPTEREPWGYDPTDMGAGSTGEKGE